MIFAVAYLAIGVVVAIVLSIVMCDHQDQEGVATAGVVGLLLWPLVAALAAVYVVFWIIHVRIVRAISDRFELSE